MSSNNQPDSRLAGSVILDSVLTLIGFAIFFVVCRSHVPSDDPTMVNLWGAITASCLTGVFWLAWQMFRVTLRGQREGDRDQK
jgi:hypothetical protein